MILRREVLAAVHSTGRYIESSSLFFTRQTRYPNPGTQDILHETTPVTSLFRRHRRA